MSRILVVEDEPAILRGLADNLKRELHEVLTAADGETGYRLIKEKEPDLVILDLMLPKLSGYEVCRKVRAEGVITPILILTARAEEADRVLGLDLGADHYVTKPFSVRELLARIRAILRHERERLHEHLRLDEELRIASQVQKRLFPQFRPPMAGMDYAGFCRPARRVSGDSYDFLALGPGRLGLLLADVAGKGISAALLGASLHASVRTCAPLLGDRCGEVLAQVNALVYEATAPESFATAFYAVYDDSTRVLTYANAGHPPPLLVRYGHCNDTFVPVTVGESCVRLDSGTPPAGIFPVLPAVQQSVQLAAGDWLLIFSDGLTEASNEKGEQFGEERLLEAMLRNGRGTAAEMCDAVLAEVRSHSSGRPQWDDMTLMAARVL